MKNKPKTRYKIRCLILLGVMSVLMNCSQTTETQTKQMSETTEDTMRLADRTETEPVEIPPIDTEATSHFETASFGLG